MRAPPERETGQDSGTGVWDQAATQQNQATPAGASGRVFFSA